MKNYFVSDATGLPGERVPDDGVLRGRDAFANNLCHPRPTEDRGSPASAEPLGVDGQPLVGYDKYRWNLCHRKPATATNKDGR